MKTFVAKVRGAQQPQRIELKGAPVWSPALRLWFIWTTCGLWKAGSRPWHLCDLPTNVRQLLERQHPEVLKPGVDPVIDFGDGP